MTLFSEGHSPAPVLKGLQVPEEEWRRAAPEANARGEIVLTVQVAHVAVGGASALVDFGLGEPAPGAPFTGPHLYRTPGVVAGLAAIGVRPEDVTHVLLTHTHPDHVLGATQDGKPRFPNARVLLGRADWDGNPAREQPGPIAHHLGALERAGLLDLVDGEREVVPGLALSPAPGETPGHGVVRVGDGAFFFLGDLVHHPCQVAHPDWVLEGRDADAVLSSRARVFAEAARTGATVTYTHAMFPGWGRIAREGDGYRWVSG